MAKRLIDIREVEGLPVIGQRYLVPCVPNRDTWPNRYRKGEWVPVTGPAHEDADLGVKGEHYHFDFRFVTERQWKRWFWPYKPSQPISLGNILMTHHVGALELRPLPCARQALEFPESRSLLTLKGECNGPVAKLEPLFREVKLKPSCRVCPHRGVLLTGLPVDAEGGTVCPGHGLRWNLATGEMMTRCTA